MIIRTKSSVYIFIPILFSGKRGKGHRSNAGLFKSNGPMASPPLSCKTYLCPNKGFLYASDRRSARSTQEQSRPMCRHRDRTFDQPSPLRKERRHYSPVPTVQILMAKPEDFFMLPSFSSRENPPKKYQLVDATRCLSTEPCCYSNSQRSRAGTSGSHRDGSDSQYTKYHGVCCK